MKRPTRTNTTAQERVRVVLADDSAAFRRAARAFLEFLPHVEVVGVAEDGEHAVALVDAARPDLVLMDLRMPRLDGLAATRRIRARFPRVRVVVMTLHDSDAWRAASVAAGADGFVPKVRLHAELAGAIRSLFPVRAGRADRSRPSSSRARGRS